ncbi:hypothetical protein, partial [Nocardia abscessus]|uniref:hypothetical protein n=1 Tax=Nocardia abscessus TaxID=120957 RepID=UPI0024570FC1
AVYFIAAKLLRRAGRGPTVIVSPLLALMRNQVAAAQRAGVVAGGGVGGVAPPPPGVRHSRR